MTHARPFPCRYKVEDRGYKTPCWIWQGATYNSGYGTLTIRAKGMSAHRYSFELHKGRIPRGAYVLHLCDVRRCVNPAHLLLGTQRDNIRQAVAKGRFVAARGERSGKHKLTDEEVAQIRDLFASGDTSQRHIASRFRIVAQQVSKIVLGQRRAAGTDGGSIGRPKWQPVKSGRSQLSKDIHELFEEKLDKTGNCWQWRGGKSNSGYGLFDSNRLPGTRRHVLAHRFAWEMFVGPIPAGMHVRHRCGNKLCCNPAHLYLFEKVGKR